MFFFLFFSRITICIKYVSSWNYQKLRVNNDSHKSIGYKKYMGISCWESRNFIVGQSLHAIVRPISTKTLRYSLIFLQRLKIRGSSWMIHRGVEFVNPRELLSGNDSGTLVWDRLVQGGRGMRKGSKVINFNRQVRWKMTVRKKAIIGCRDRPDARRWKLALMNNHRTVDQFLIARSGSHAGMQVTMIILKTLFGTSRFRTKTQKFDVE